MRKTYLPVFIAPWSMKHILAHSGNGRVSKKAIKAAIAAGRPVEFADAITGQYMSVELAREAGIRTLEVRYNNKRDCAVIAL